MKKGDWVVCLDDDKAQGELRRGRLYRVVSRPMSSEVVVEDYNGIRADWNEPGKGTGTRWIAGRFAVVRKAGVIEEGDLVENIYSKATWFYGDEELKKNVKRLIFPDSIPIRNKIRKLLDNLDWQSPDAPNRIKDKILERAEAEEKAAKAVGRGYQKHAWVVCINDTDLRVLVRGDYVRITHARGGFIDFVDASGKEYESFAAYRFSVVQGAGEVFEGDVVKHKGSAEYVAFHNGMFTDEIEYVEAPQSEIFQKRCCHALGIPWHGDAVKERADREGERIGRKVREEAVVNSAMIDRDGPPELDRLDVRGAVTEILREDAEAATLARAVAITEDAGVNSGLPYQINEDCTRFIPGSRGKEVER